jgi:hypothetical protein
MFENLEWQLSAKDDASAKFEKVKKAQDDLVSSSEKSAVAGDKAGSSWKGIAGGVAVGTLAVQAARQAFSFLKGTIDESIQQAQEFQNNQAALSAAIVSTKGAAGLTVEELNNMAKELQNITAVDDDVINSMQTMQLTFTNIKAPVFKEVSLAVLDMATAMNQNALPSAEQLQTASIQLGKAMQDPIVGATALQRVGIKLSEQQKEQIKTMVKAGDVMGAQKVILGELSTEFGGRAAAAANTYQGQMARLNNTVGDVKQQIGRALIPTLTLLAGTVTDSTGKIVMNENQLHDWQKKIYQAATIAIGAIKVIGNFIKVVFTMGKMVFDAGQIIGGVFVDMGRAIFNFGRDAKEVFKAMGQAFSGDFQGAWQTLKNSMKSQFSTTITMMRGFGSDSVKALVGLDEAFNPLTEAIQKATDLKAFDAQITAMKAAEEASKQYAGGMTDAVADVGAETEKKAKDIQSAWEKVRDTYKDGGEKISEALAKLEEDHSSSVKTMTDKMVSLKQQFLDTVSSYKNAVADMNKTEAEKFVDQEKKIADLKKQIQDEQASAINQEDRTKNDERINQLTEQLQKEQAALDKYADRAKEISDEITEAKRRAGQTDFANFQEDLALKRKELDADHLKKLNNLKTETEELQKSMDEEKVIYEGKKAQYNAVAAEFLKFHDTYIDNLNDMKKNTDKSVSDMNKKLQDMLAILAQIESAKNRAGLLGSGGQVAPSGGNTTSPSNNAPGGNITINLGGVTVDSQSRADDLVAEIARQIQLQSQGSN